MANPLSLKFFSVKRHGKIRDSLELLKLQPKVKLNKIPHHVVQAALTDESIDKFNLLDDTASSICHESEYKDDESSVEETRDASTSISRGCFFESEDYIPCNSTVNEGALRITQFKAPIVSPIEEYCWHNLQGKNSQLQNNETEGEDCNEISQLKLTDTKDDKLATLSDSDDDDWLNTSRDGDPVWLTSPPNLVPAPVRTYTPTSAKRSTFDIEMKPRKRLLRTSSPAPLKASPKAKRLLMETDLSSICSDDGSVPSVELVPRPPTPGTVNSDEIVPCELSSGRSQKASFEIFFPVDEGSIEENTQEGAVESAEGEFPSDVIERLPSPCYVKPLIIGFDSIILKQNPKSDPIERIF